MKSKSFMLMVLSMGFGLVAAIGISQGESVVCLAQVPANRGECGDYIMVRCRMGITTYHRTSITTLTNCRWYR